MSSSATLRAYSFRIAFSRWSEDWKAASYAWRFPGCVQSIFLQSTRSEDYIRMQAVCCLAAYFHRVENHSGVDRRAGSLPFCCEGTLRDLLYGSVDAGSCIEPPRCCEEKERIIAIFSVAWIHCKLSFSYAECFLDAWPCCKDTECLIAIFSIAWLYCQFFYSSAERLLDACPSSTDQHPSTEHRDKMLLYLWSAVHSSIQPKSPEERQTAEMVNSFPGSEYLTLFSFIAATWCVDAGFLMFLYCCGAATEQYYESQEAEGLSSSYYSLHVRSSFIACPDIVWRSRCMRSERPLLNQMHGNKQYEWRVDDIRPIQPVLLQQPRGKRYDLHKGASIPEIKVYISKSPKHAELVANSKHAETLQDTELFVISKTHGKHRSRGGRSMIFNAEDTYA